VPPKHRRSKKEKYYDIAERLAVEDGYNQSEIREYITTKYGESISPTTISGWSKWGDWPGQRKKFVRTRRSLRDRIFTIVDQVLQDLEAKKADYNAADIDKMLKAVRSLKDAETELDISAAIVAFWRDLVDFAREADTELLQALNRNAGPLKCALKEKYLGNGNSK